MNNGLILTKDKPDLWNWAHMYQSGKDYKAIFKALRLQRTTVRAIIHKWRTFGTFVNLPRSGRPTKITPRVQWGLIQVVIKEHRTTSKELQVSLTSIKVSVHDSTIREKKTGQKRHPWESSKNTRVCLTFATNILIISKTFGQIFCRLMRQTFNFLEGVCPITSGIKPTQDFIKRTSYQQSNMVVVVWWFGDALQLKGLGDFT